MLIVQKYGGTSVGNVERIEAVAKRVIETKKEGNDLIVVVSAMSGETNKLLEFAGYFSQNPNQREVDMLLSSGERVTSALLAIALNAMGYPAVSMSGRKAGIVTDSLHTKARIEHIDTASMEKELKNGNIIVLAGFQGVTENGEVSTLGRGGSDLSAVAVAGALHADLCEIYTDVDGVYTTDPRIEPKAKKLDKNQARVTLRGVTDKPGIAAEIFKKLADANVNVDMIIQNVGHDGTTNLGFTVPQNELDLTKKAMSELRASDVVEYDSDIVKVSIVGVGMKSHSGVACTAFDTMAKEGINIEMISTSEIKVSMVIQAKYGELAVRTLHNAYQLDK